MTSYKKIKLTQGKYAIVDVEDFEELNKFRWHFHKSSRDRIGYARRNKLAAETGTAYIRGSVMMHHQILPNSDRKNLHTDHINGNSLDNRRKNLRLVTPSLSVQNRSLTNKYKIVGVNKTINHRGEPTYWIARITVAGQRKYLGVFKTKEEATIAYSTEFSRIHGRNPS